MGGRGGERKGGGGDEEKKRRGGGWGGGEGGWRRERNQIAERCGFEGPVRSSVFISGFGEWKRSQRTRGRWIIGGWRLKESSVGHLSKFREGGGGAGWWLRDGGARGAGTIDRRGVGWRWAWGCVAVEGEGRGVGVFFRLIGLFDIRVWGAEYGGR